MRLPSTRMTCVARGRPGRRPADDLRRPPRPGPRRSAPRRPAGCRPRPRPAPSAAGRPSGTSVSESRSRPRGRRAASRSRSGVSASMSSMFSGRNGASSGSSSRLAQARAAPGSSRSSGTGSRRSRRPCPASSTRPRGTSVRITPSHVDPAHRRHPGPGHRLAVGDHGQRLQRRLGQPGLLAVERRTARRSGAHRSRV